MKSNYAMILQDLNSRVLAKRAQSCSVPYRPTSDTSCAVTRVAAESRIHQMSSGKFSTNLFLGTYITTLVAIYHLRFELCLCFSMFLFLVKQDIFCIAKPGGNVYNSADACNVIS